MSTPANEIICYGQSRGFGWVQEWYETSSRHAGERARQLRQMGFQVTVGAMGSQVTSVGRVNMTLVSIRTGERWEELPEVRIER